MELFVSLLSCWIFSISLLATCTAHSDLWHYGSAAQNASGLQLGTDNPPLRNVYAVSDIALQPVVISPESGKELLYGHVSDSTSFHLLKSEDLLGAVQSLRAPSIAIALSPNIV